MDTRRDFADTGASVSATGRLDILHHFTPHTPYEIMGYDGTITRTVGQGIAYVKSPDQDKLEETFFVYIPSVDGTIISLEHHTCKHPTLHKWTQEATPASDADWVTFRDAKVEGISRYKTKQEMGLYYIRDLDSYPVQHDTIVTCQQTNDNPDMADELAIKMRTTHGNPTNYVDFDPDLATMNMVDQLSPVIEWQTPRSTCVIAKIQNRQKTCTGTDILNFETWHQRLAHCSEKWLRQTQKLVDGMPAFYGPKLTAVVTCRTCDVAKLKKAPRGKNMDDSVILLKGQVFQMEIGFIRRATEFGSHTTLEGRCRYESY